MKEPFKELDTKELDFPDTTFVRDIETKVFQSITLQCLAKIEGISLIEGNIFDNLLGREGADRIKGISVEQEQKNHSVKIKVEINVDYGVNLPAKAEEIQTKVAEEISNLPGLHVSCVHVVFKNLVNKKAEEEAKKAEDEAAFSEYSDDF